MRDRRPIWRSARACEQAKKRGPPERPSRKCTGERRAYFGRFLCLVAVVLDDWPVAFMSVEVEALVPFDIEPLVALGVESCTLPGVPAVPLVVGVPGWPFMPVPFMPVPFIPVPAAEPVPVGLAGAEVALPVDPLVVDPAAPVEPVDWAIAADAIKAVATAKDSLIM